MASISLVYDNQIAVTQAVAESLSLGETLRRLGLSHTGNSRTRLRTAIECLGLSTAHFTPNGRSSERKKAAAKPLAEHLVLGSRIASTVLKERLWAAGLLPRYCQLCGQGEVWNDQPLVLQLDHCNGNRRDNRIGNLRILCPNCHSQTDTFAGRALRRVMPVVKSAAPTEGGLVFGQGQVAPQRADKISWPDNQTLAQLVWSKPLSALGPILGVSDRAIKKRCDKLGLSLPPQGYWLTPARAVAAV